MNHRNDVQIDGFLQRKINYRRKQALAQRLNRIMPALIFGVVMGALVYLLITRL